MARIIHITYDITEIRGDWALGNSGNDILVHARDCCTLSEWVWHEANATGWASYEIWTKPEVHSNIGITDAEFIALSIKQAGRPENSFCFEAS